MNILIDIRPLQERQKSGVGTYTDELLNALFKIDQKNQYFLFSNSSQSVGIDIPPHRNGQVIHRHFKYPNKILNGGFKFLDWPKIDQLIGAKIDLCLFPNLNFLAIGHGVKTILVIHDLSFEIYPSFFPRKGRLWHWLINASKLTQWVDQIVAVSQKTKTDLIKIYGLPTEKITVIYPGIAERFCPINDADRLKKFRDQYGLPEKFILYLGSLEPRKNVLGLIRAFELLKQKTSLPHALVLAGGLGYQASRILQQIKTSTFSHEIKYLGYIKEKDKPVLYNLADLFVYPSFYEGFGFPPLEALACATPTLASWAGALHETVGSICPTLFNPYQINELALAMTKTLTNPRARSLASEVRTEILNRYSWPKAARSFLNLIES